ncbi:MAG: linear amide C-N hydrolase [Schleiferiaceae bacterium]|nr:linear amide C-N hydrolase [Schleiferiaceae bacterium]
MKKFPIALFILSFFGVFNTADACTRVVYKGPNETVITARSMDFSMEIPANLWVFPKGIARNGEVGKNSIQWTSKYGSIIASSWDIGTSDGMNEKGMVANMLWLVESKYAPFDKDGDLKGLSVSLWAQYALDNFATVAEAVKEFEKREFVVVTDFIPGTNKYTTVHLSLSDATGDNAILEYINGQLVIHHDPSYTVMTNDPPYEEQLAISKYWRKIPGNIVLPGTNNPADRFARAAFYIDAIPQTDKTRVAVASVFSVIRNCSVPYGITTEGFPNISSTRWRVVADQKNKVYYFENVLTPNTLWVDLNKFDLSEKGAIMKLDLSGNQTYSGESSKSFKKSKPFQFQGL